MPKIKALLIFTLLLSIALSQTPLYISSVSLQNVATTTSLQGSILGGTKLYFQGYGFSTTMTQNNIYVGEFPCKLLDGASATAMVCETTATPQYKQYWNLDIYMLLGLYGENGFAMAPNKFSYTFGQTPYIYSVSPSVSYGGAGTKLYFYGAHRIFDLGADKDLGDVYGIYVGDSLCSRFGIFQDQISPNGAEYIQCNQATLQKAGKYKVSEFLFPGKSTNFQLTWKATLNNKDQYQFVVLPLVNDTTHSGSIAGQELLIKGTGFSLDMKDVTVQVDGVNCKVTESTFTYVKCTLQKKTTQTANITSNATTPINTYISGSGFFYQRYDISAQSPQTIQKLKYLLDTSNTSALHLQTKSVSGQIRTQNTFGSYYGQVWKGYFTPTVSGNHKFRGIADDSFAVYMNATTVGSTTTFTNSSLIAFSNTCQSTTIYPNYYQTEIATAQSSYINLVAGKQYYMEVYHVNLAGNGQFSLSVQVPNIDTTIQKWQTYEVQAFTTTMVQDPQIVQFTQIGATTGTINLKVYQVDAVTGDVLNDKNVTIAWNANAATFCNAINQFSWYGSYSSTCTLTMSNSDGPTTDPSIAETFVWRVSIAKFRSTAVKNHKFTIKPATGSTLTIATVQQHSPLLSGSFSLSIDGVPINIYNSTTALYTVSDIPFNVDPSVLEQAIRQIPALQYTQVERSNDPLTGATWFVYFVGYNKDLPLLVASGAKLVGGKLGTTPSLNVILKRNFSTNLFVDPIDYRFMRTYSSKPNVRVTVSGIPSACNADCTYDFLASVPKITAATLSSNTLSLTLTNPGSLTPNLTNGDVTVTLNNQPCVNLTGILTSFTCDLPKNTDNTAILTAGNHLPIVMVKSIGYVDIDPSVVPINVPLNLTSITANSGGLNGGYDVTIVGVGFPAKMSDITFTLCSKTCTVTSLNNIQAIVTVPECGTSGAKNIQASFNSLTSTTVEFTYGAASNTVQITGINPISWSPVLKGVMNITGSGFGIDKTLLKVYLTNSSGNIYQMKILELTDVLIKVGIPGGLPGNFKVNVIQTGFGNAIASPSTANDFVYEVVVDDISPATGSVWGGTLITITGKNFVTDVLDTMVTIGNETNQLCKIQSITTTQIKCRTPPKNFYYNVSVPQIVLVNSKLIIDSTCSLTFCGFTFSGNDTSPQLDSLSSTALTTSTAGPLTLTGLRFNTGASTKVSLTNKISGKVTQVIPTASSATDITFTVPALESGLYDVRARVDPIGESNPIVLTINHIIDTPTPSTFSVNGGVITIKGSGFPETWPSKYYNKLSFSTGLKTLPTDIVSCTPTQIVLNIPKGVSARAYKFSITNVLNVKKQISFSQQSTSTPNVNLVSTATITSNTATVVKLNRTNLATTAPQKVIIYSVTNPDTTIDVPTWTQNSTQFYFTVTLNSGKYGFKVYDDVYGWYSVSTTSFLTVSKSGTYTLATTPTSFNGGIVTVTGNNIGEGATITVNGLKGKVLTRTPTSADFSVPKLVTPTTQSSFKLAKNKTLNLKQTKTWGDTAGWEAAFDTDHSSIYTSNNATCNVGIDIGLNLGVQITRIRYFPNPSWTIASTYIKGGVIQVSNDNTTWITIATVDQTVHAGWNSFMISDTTLYRYIRFSHTSASKCNLAELELSGIVMSTVTIASIASFPSDAAFDDGVTQQTFAGAVEYREDHTPLITAVSPDKGDVFGGYDITLTGLYLNVGTPVVTIDGITCVYKSSTATQIVCTVGSRLALPTEVFFKVMIGGIPAITQKQFRYVMRWSDHRTWGTDLPPVKDDLVYVPHGMHLLVDQTTPILNSIIVENGTIQFSDQKDMVVSAGFITLRGGQFIAGTEQNNYLHQLTFVMYGNYYGPQQPMFGNKGIGCLQCKFSMIGKKRTPTWTMLANTVSAGQNQFTTLVDVDWQVGQHIVVASTSYDHNEAQERVIKTINNRTITVDKKFQYNHIAVVDNYGTDKIEMRAQVGLLSRNIKMMGDDTSVATDYGSHLMLTGSAQNGLVGKIAYTQFTKCGQPQIVGRYCHHFHMAGDVPESYSIGNAVHHSMARILTIHGVHFLYVAWNVGYRVKGHNFFIEDGVETNNVLQYNLAISSLLVNNMMQTDMSVASFWVTNPSNHLRHNHAAGSDFYGFWYEIKEHPDGPSASQDICPIGNPLGESHDNVAHSNVRFGLRIFKLYSRQFPCVDIRDDSLVDPWSANPSIQSKFYNYVLWKNGEAGLLAQQTGNMVFQNFTIAESKLAGMEFYKTNFTKQRVIARNFVIIGKANGNPGSDAQLVKAKGAILSRTGQMQVQNIRFYEFTADMTVWQACSKCDNLLLYTNFGATYYASAIKYNNVFGPLYNMLGLKRQVFYDLDGSLTNEYFDNNTRTSATLSYGWPHLLQDTACLSADDPTLWDTGTVCDQTVTVRQVMFTNMVKKQQFKSQSLKARKINSLSEFTNPNLAATQYTSAFSLQKSMEPKKQVPFTYSLPYITGRVYNIWWGTGIDFSHLAMVTSHLYGNSQSGIIFKFNYTDSRQLFEIGPFRQGKPFNRTLMKLQSATLDSNTCGNGDYYQDNSNNTRQLALCASGKNRTFYEYIDVNAVYCRLLCPAPPGSCQKQPFVRIWNNASQWGGSMPKDGDNITIPCAWTIVMDINPARIGYFQISGDLNIPDVQDITIVAENIWLQGSGSIKAGQSITAPFAHNLKIQLNGVKNASGFTVSPLLTGNKMFVVTGKLELYGIAPATTWTRMTVFADAGATSITVASTTGWKVGDQIGIAPSFSNPAQFEKVTITAITSNVVTFTPALKYSHFGDGTPTIVKQFGTLDMRTGIAHLTRNIKITAGSDDGWGFTLIQFGFTTKVGNITTISTGKMNISGVQFIKGGQYDTQEAALQIFNVRTQTNHTLITKSSFHQCQDFCMHIQNVFDVQITNNVFFNARKYHVLALQTFYFNFTNNLMIGVTKRPTMSFNELIGCYASYQAVDASTAKINVTNNLCQGSQGNGYIVPDVDCNDIDIYPYAGNTAGSCDIGWLFARGTGSCLGAKGIYAYASQIGQMHNPADTVTIKFKNFILADNIRSMTIRIGGSSEQKTGYLYDSYITAIARPACPKCYGQLKTICSNNHGVRMLTTGQNGQKLPDKFGHGFDVVCKQESIDGKVFIYNTEFNNFRTSYPTLPQCANNVVFRPHSGADDITGSHHLFDSKCTDCQLQAAAYFPSPNVGHIGWFGGCGSILCTGNNNYFVHDHTGTFLPAKGILLANNSWIGDNTATCTKIPSMNGHYCTNEDFGVLEYQSIAPDFNTRIMWPVNLTFDGGSWTSITNGWREWQWNGGQPLNKRLGRFVSVVQLNKVYNMSFTSMPPEDMTLKIQKRLPEGTPSDWVVVKLYYPKPNSIRVQVGGLPIKAISLLDNNGLTPLDTTKCGSNKFFYKNYTIHFVVTGDPACQVRVTLTNSIQLTARFDMDINQFYADDGVTKFINRMCALLQINDTSRVKVVGVYSGSTQVQSMIQAKTPPVGQSASTDPSSAGTELQILHTQLKKKIASGDFASAMTSDGGFGALLGVSSLILNQDVTTTSSDSSSNTGLIIGVVLGATFVVCLSIIGAVCYMRKRAKISQLTSEQLPAQSETHKQADSHMKATDNFSLVNLKVDKKEIY